MTVIVQHGLDAPAGDLPFTFGEPLYDNLDDGPHYVDWRIERSLRLAYDDAIWSDADRVPRWITMFEQHSDVVFSATRELGSALAALWWLDVMHQHGVATERVRLAVTQPFADAAKLAAAVADAPRVGDAAIPLRELRRAIAADDDALDLPVDAVPQALRAWASVVRRIRDLLPDERGLDARDELLLKHATAEWQRVPHVIGGALFDRPADHRVGDLTLWQRLQVLARDASPIDPRDEVLIDEDDEAPTTRRALVELRFNGEAAMRCAEVRRTTLGDDVLAGRVDAIAVRQFRGWCGGRLLTNERVMRAGSRLRR